MSTEFEVKGMTKIIRRRPTFLAGTIAAAGIAFGSSQPVNENRTPSPDNAQETSKAYHLTDKEIAKLKYPLITLESASPKMENPEDGNGNKNEKFKRLLENTNVRLLVGSALVYSLAATVNSYRLGGKYEEKKLQILRTSGPLFLTASLATAEISSITDLDRHVAVSLFTAFTFLTGAYNVINTFEREKNTKTRALAATTSGALATIGILTLNAVHKI